MAASPAEIIGPDGIAYPDWRRAGIAGGIPNLPVVAKVVDFGGQAGDEQDDTEAIRAAIAAASAAGGGAVEFGTGAYILREPICITADGIVLRGQGPDQTLIRFVYGLDRGEVRFVHPAPNATVPLDTTVEVHAFPGEKDSTYDAQSPGQLESLALWLGDKMVAETKSNEGGPFRCAIPLWRITRESGPLELVARASWVGGATAETRLSFRVDASYLPHGQRRLTSHAAAFTFIGDEWSGRGLHRWMLAEDAPRGSLRLRPVRDGGEFARPLDLPGFTPATRSPAPAEVLRPGDAVAISALTPEAWKKATGNVRDFSRLNYARVAAIDGEDIVLDRPLRFDLNTAESARLDVRHPLQGGGVEGLTLVQERRLWTHGIEFRFAENCWVRGVIVRKAGRNPISIEYSAHIEVRDTLLEDGWYQLGGGSSYFGFSTAFDCLAERVVTRRLRHAPVVNWSAAGNVFRDSSFDQSDANWHTAWTHENLLERCTIVATKGSGSYGYGLYTSRHRSFHGGTGPRNVFYANTFLAPDAGIYFGGAVADTMVLYNRFIVKNGPAIVAEPRSDSVRLTGNAFVVAAPRAPWVALVDGAKPTGWLLEQNTVSGGTGIVLPKELEAQASNNHAVPLDAKQAAMVPPAASIFLWQREQHPLQATIGAKPQ